jgi:ceramide glucosyltransferase
MSSLALAGAALVLMSVAFCTVCVYLLLTHIHPDASLRRHTLTLPPISIIKPLAGIEEALQDNLTSFFVQDYAAPVELIFCSLDPSDPAMRVADAVAQRFPNIATRFIVSTSAALNPKIANLTPAIKECSYDKILLSDANVCISPNYLTRMVEESLSTGASVVSNLVVGVGEASVGAAFENGQLTTFVASALCFALRVGRTTCVIGKSILLDRRELNELGGIERFSNFLCEDFLLGQSYVQAGKRVVLSRSTVVFNRNQGTTVGAFFNRHVRWLRMTATIKPLALPAQALGYPLVFALGTALVWPAHGWAIAMFLLLAVAKAWCDNALARRMRGMPMRFAYLVLSPMREFIMFAAILYAMAVPRVRWRNRYFWLYRNSEIHHTASSGSAQTKSSRE